jgi:hypothetical protein
VLAFLKNIPNTPQDWNLWSFHHRDSHDRIRAAIAAQGGPQLIDYLLDPIPGWAIAEWLLKHDQTHTDMDAYLGVQSADLQDVDFDDQKQAAAWRDLHYNEHFTAERALGL